MTGRLGGGKAHGPSIAVPDSLGAFHTVPKTVRPASAIAGSGPWCGSAQPDRGRHLRAAAGEEGKTLLATSTSKVGPCRGLKLPLTRRIVSVRSSVRAWK